MNKKHKGLAMAKAGFKVGLAYRFEFLIQIILAPISLIIFYFLWKSIFDYSGTDVIKGFTFTAMISYYVLNMMVAFFTHSDVERWMEYNILHGYLINDLLRPIHYFKNLFYFQWGINILALVLEAIPVLFIGIFFFGVMIATKLNMLLFVISLLFASLLYFLLSYVIGLSAFWLKRIGGISRAKKPLIAFLGGGLLPLTFFPEGVRTVLEFLPFQYVRFVPIAIYLGHYSLYESIFYLGVQLVWIIGLYLLAQIIWKKAFKKFAAVGV